MKMKHGILTLSLGLAVALGGFSGSQAFFNSPLAANSHYRPINFGMGYEMYVDLSSLETVKDDGQGWIFKVNLFRSPEDSGNIEGTYTLTYKVAHGQAWLYNDSTHSWQEIPMRKKEIKHKRLRQGDGALLQGGVKAVTAVRGPALHRGDCIGIAAPATHDEGQDISAAVTRLERAGYRVKMTPTVTGNYGFFSGTDEERARDINALFHDDDVKAIICLNGGYGSARILDKLDYDFIAAHPKLVVGFSDVTALQIALWEKCRLVTANGPLMVTLGGSDAYTAGQFFQGLTTDEWQGPLALPSGRKLTTVVPGQAEGPIVGGNLTVLTSLVGTPYALDGTGCILVPTALMIRATSRRTRCWIIMLIWQGNRPLRACPSAIRRIRPSCLTASKAGSMLTGRARRLPLLMVDVRRAALRDGPYDYWRLFM